MAVDAKYRYGEVVTTQYAHANAQAKGAVILVNNYPLVAQADLGANESGAYGANGGVYELVVKAANTILPGALVSIDLNVGVGYQATVSAGPHFGYALTGGTAGQTVLVVHDPTASA